MFQINPDSGTRSVTLSVNAQEKETFNQLFAELQQLEGEKTYFKDLILVALQRAISSTPPNEVQELRDQVEQLSLALENANQSKCVCTPEEYQVKLDRISELENQVGVLQSHVQEFQNLEIEEPDETAIIENFKRNHVAFELNDDQRACLNQIIQNRKTKKVEQYLSYSEIVRGLALNNATLYNWGGEFYTGL